MFTLHNDMLVIKEPFYQSSVHVEVGNLLGCQVYCICLEHKLPVLFFAIAFDETEFLGVVPVRVIDSQLNL